MKQAIRKFTHFQSLKRQEIDMEGNFVDSDKATENSNFSKGVNDFFREIEGPYAMIRGPRIRDSRAGIWDRIIDLNRWDKIYHWPHKVNKENQQYLPNIQLKVEFSDLMPIFVMQVFRWGEDISQRKQKKGVSPSIFE